MYRVAILIALAGTIAPGAQKDRGWQSGTLLDTENNMYFGRGYASLSDTTMSFGDRSTGSEIRVGGRSPADSFILDEYVIESETYVYLVHIMRLRSNKPYQLLANMSVKFAIEKKKLWLLDAGGAELQTSIAKMKPKFQPTQ
jgi:hypothetical protein